MAVVSEPPWINFGSGTAARNGTTSHTISFGFTSTSGSLLVAIIHGAVTHTVSGWTEQAQPVATGECSLFTKTSAGDSSITVTHNGSDYPVNWVVYEFPAGSTVTGVDSTTGSDDTMVGLTGLPGTEQVVIGAVGRVAVGSESGASATWTSPWVEDADLFTAASGTDGTHLTVGRQINVTATSSTPTTSINYSGTWSNGAREKISAAFDVAVAASTVDGTATVTGAGAVTAAVVQDATATASGVGATSAVARLQSGAAVAGSGGVSASVAQQAAATVTGAGATVALATQVPVATPAGAGSVSAAAIVIVPGSAAIAGAGAVTALVRQVVGATVAGAGQVTTTSGSRITPRPNTGTTVRPYAGITVRP